MNQDLDKLSGEYTHNRGIVYFYLLVHPMTQFSNSFLEDLKRLNPLKDNKNQIIIPEKKDHTKIITQSLETKTSKRIRK